MIQDGKADVMALDTGQGYFAGRYHNMQPLVAEKYASGSGKLKSMLLVQVSILKRNNLYLDSTNKFSVVSVCFCSLCLKFWIELNPAYEK